MTLVEEIRRYWDDDAATYDKSPRHLPKSAAVLAAWTALLERTLPEAPARILDCGAGTGFLTLIAARLGHAVTALDISSEMLARLRQATLLEGLDVAIVEGPAETPPPGFDIVMERNLLWTLPDPATALRSWRRSSPSAQLLSIGSIWGTDDPVERLRVRGRGLVGRLHRRAPDHHGSYSDEVLTSLPLSGGALPERVVELVTRAGWSNPRLLRLRDIEWAETHELRPTERLFGVPPRFAVIAG